MIKRLKKFTHTILLSGVAHMSLVDAETIKLDDFQVMNVNSSHPLEPSGLTLKEGQLYMVSDDEYAIYKINVLDTQNVEAVVEQSIDLTQLSVMNLDLEGISVVDDSFFVVSEVHHKLIRIDGDKSTWVPKKGSVYADAFQAGLFQLYNAGMEAVTYLGNHTFLASVERQPRGLIEITFDEDFQTIVKQTNQVFDDSKYPLLVTRKPDFAGLYFHNEKIYALHRNAYIIHELIKDVQGVYQEGQAWSYEHIVKDPKYSYQDMQFGHAEGLAVDDDHFYLILDNNNNPRLQNPTDNRSILIKAKRK